MASSHALQEFSSYALSFGAFYLFIFIARHSCVRGGGLFSSLARTCAGTPSASYTKLSTKENGNDESSRVQNKQNVLRQAMLLAFSALGIQVAYVCWGVMQETIMTTRYSAGERFTSSKFLVFVNRIIALLVSSPLAMREKRHAAARLQSVSDDETILVDAVAGPPLYRYSFCSVSNIISSACQYEALKFVSFPTQVLSKACKIIPTMLMGYFVSRKQYAAIEYVLATALTAGVILFKLNEENDAPVQDTQLVGMALLVAYMAADAFTSNWQSKLFLEYPEVSSMQMMCFVNLFSSLFTFAGLFLSVGSARTEAHYVIDFVRDSPEISNHMLLMAVCSAIGQLFIFYVIRTFGPLVFAIIQTVRQFLSVVLSIVLFGHPVNSSECLGILIVFSALAAQIVYKANAMQTRSADRSTPR